MAIWAIVIGGRVTNIVDAYVANTQSGKVIDVSDLNIKPQRGWWWDGSSFKKVPHDITMAKAHLRLQINNLRNNFIERPITYLGRQYDADDRALTMLMMWAVFLLNGGTLPAGFTWRDANNEDVPFTGAMLRGLWQEVKDRRFNIMTTSWNYKQQVLNATTIEELEAIKDILDQW
jgi:hypothetical protein